MAFILATPSPPAEERGSGEWLQPDKTDWVGRKEVKGGKTRDQEKLSLPAQPGSGLMTLQLRHQI